MMDGMYLAGNKEGDHEATFHRGSGNGGCWVVAESGFAQGNPRETAKISVGSKTISVEYGRPSLKGRSVADLLQQLKAGGFLAARRR